MKITGFIHLTELSILDYIDKFLHKGAYHLHSVEHNSWNTPNGMRFQLHREIMFLRMAIPLCSLSGSKYAYICRDHNYFGSSPCSCGQSTYAIEDITLTK